MKRHTGRLVGTAEAPQKADRIAATPKTSALVESRMGAVAWGLWPTLRFPFPLIEPDVPASGIRLSDWLHRKAHDAAHSWQAFQAQHSALPMQHFEWEPVVAAPCHFVPSDEEGAHALADVEVDAAECRPPRPVAEVVLTSRAEFCSACRARPARVRDCPAPAAHARSP